MKNIKENQELQIKDMQGLCNLMDSLINSGYELQMYPVYEEPDEKRPTYGRRFRPLIDHYVVKIGEKKEPKSIDE